MFRKTVSIFFMALFLFGIQGCGFYFPANSAPESTAAIQPTSAAPAINLPQLNSPWQITLTQTGGIAGVSRSMVIVDSGKVVFTDLRSQKTINLQLSDKQLAEISQLVSSARYREPSMPSACADCFLYTLNIKHEQLNFDASLDDVSLKASGLTSLITYLQKLLTTALGS